MGIPTDAARAKILKVSLPCNQGRADALQCCHTAAELKVCLHPKVMLHDLLQLSSIPAIHTKACEVPKLVVSAQSWSRTFKP